MGLPSFGACFEDILGSMVVKEYRRLFKEDDAPGWQSIDEHLGQLYPGIEPTHWGPKLYYRLAGPDPLDGISLYENRSSPTPHLHYISYGLTNLYYDEESLNQEFSGFGFELTFRLKPYYADDNLPVWVPSLMQNIARYVFQSRSRLDDLHCMPANGPIRLNTDTQITGLIFFTDPELGVIQTPHGKVKFLQMVGITDAELNSIRRQELDRQTLVDTLSVNNPLLITDLTRP